MGTQRAEGETRIPCCAKVRRRIVCACSRRSFRHGKVDAKESHIQQKACRLHQLEKQSVSPTFKYHLRLCKVRWVPPSCRAARSCISHQRHEGCRYCSFENCAYHVRLRSTIVRAHRVHMRQCLLPMRTKISFLKRASHMSGGHSATHWSMREAARGSSCKRGASQTTHAVTVPSSRHRARSVINLFFCRL